MFLSSFYSKAQRSSTYVKRREYLEEPKDCLSNRLKTTLYQIKSEAINLEHITPPPPPATKFDLLSK